MAARVANWRQRTVVCAFQLSAVARDFVAVSFAAAAAATHRSRDSADDAAGCSSIIDTCSILRIAVCVEAARRHHLARAWVRAWAWAGSTEYAACSLSISDSVAASDTYTDSNTGTGSSSDQCRHSVRSTATVEVVSR
jgi:hypothetical protein